MVTQAAQLQSPQVVPPPLELRPLGLLLGLLITGLGLYLALVFVPEHDPGNIGRGGVGKALSQLNQWFLKPELVGLIRLASWGIAGLGIFQLITGSAARRGKVGHCAKCGCQVVARRPSFSFSYKCERCGSTVRV
jgi:hypothetical protein